MTTPRDRRRQRRQNDFSEAEMEWLDGQHRPEASKFWRYRWPTTEPHGIDHRFALLERARHWLPAERVQILEKQIDAAVEALREYTDFANWPHPRDRQ